VAPKASIVAKAAPAVSSSRSANDGIRGDEIGFGHSLGCEPICKARYPFRSLPITGSSMETLLRFWG
jgi:hypothetical protein